MNNSAKERLIFFCGYYFRKIFSLTTADDQFRKRFYRATGKAAVSIIAENEHELQFSLKRKDEKDIQFCVRKKNSSDIQVFAQVFDKKEYEALVNKIFSYGKNPGIRFIIDAGANVGFTSLYLQQFFPDAFFLVIEPDEKNFEQMQKNFKLNNLENTEMYLSGLWSSDGWLKINKDAFGGKEWGYYVTASDRPTNLKGISLPTLLSKTDFPFIGILKIDIEGGEKELFRQEEIIAPILQKTRFIAIEIHDHLADRQHILAILKKNNFSWFDHEELTIATNQSLPA
jgi:FkbM family methyltransferase